MHLTIDGKSVDVRPEESLRDMVTQAGLEDGRLSRRPLAAKIAGEVFTLNYVPLRRKDCGPERPSIRRAMAASDGEVRLLRYADPAGKEVYIRTAQFLIFLALRQLWPEATAKMTCTLGESVFIQIKDAKDFSAEALRKRIRELVQEDFPLIRRRVPLDQAVERFRYAETSLLIG